MGKLQHNFQEEALLPNDALRSCGDCAVTKDGVNVYIRYRGTYDNTNGQCEKWLEKLSRDIYNVPFRIVETKWKSIMPIGKYWSRIRMERVEEKTVQITDSQRKSVTLRKGRK